MVDTPEFSKGAVVAPHHLAAQWGKTILSEGGNAIEAMVAMAAAIAVVYPHMNGLGGDGFWLIRTPDGKVRAIEACGQAGTHATIERYRALGYEKMPVRGPYAAATVAGAIGGWQIALDLARNLGGQIPLQDLLSEAVRLAKEGAPVSQSEGRYIVKERETLLGVPNFIPHFRSETGDALPAGTLRQQPALAQTLAQLAHSGLSDFYRGDLAREIAGDLEQAGSPVTRADLKAYEARWRTPLSIRLPGMSLYNSPAPTQGIASLLLHGIFHRLDAPKAESFAHLHGLIESAKRAYAIRDRVVTDFDHQMLEPNDFLTDQRFAREAGLVAMDRAAAWPFAKADGDTIWMGAIDAAGTSVSFIQSIFWEYGSGVVLPKTGLLWQNRASAFSLDPKALNPLIPGRKPFHTLNVPLALFDDGRVMSYGAMGGDGQPQFQAQMFFRAIRYGQSLGEAIDQPRFLFGKTWGKDSATLKVENRFDPSLLKALEKAGHQIELIDKPYADMFGHGGLLMRAANGRVQAVHDPRSDGSAEGV